MKKLIYLFAAAIVAVVAVDAQAIMLLKKDGFSWEVQGDWQIQFRTDYGDKNQDCDIEYDDSEIKNRITYDLPNGWTAFGQLDFGWEKAADSSDKEGKSGSTGSNSFGTLEENYLGFQYDKFKFLFGKTNTPVDKATVHIAKEDVGPKSTFQEVGRTDGDDLILVSYVSDRFTIGASTEIEASSEQSAGYTIYPDTTKYSGADAADATFSDVFATATFGLLKVGAAYQYVDTTAVSIMKEFAKTTVLDKDNGFGIWALMANYKFKYFTLGADYSEAQDLETVWQVAASIPVDQVTVQLGYINTQYLGNKNDVSQSTVNQSSSAATGIKGYNSAAGAAYAVTGDDQIAGWYTTFIYTFKTANKVNVFTEFSGVNAGTGAVKASNGKYPGAFDRPGWIAGMNINF